MTGTDESVYEPARVHIVRDDTKHTDRTLANVVSKTFVATTTGELILPRSAGRRCATIMVLGVVGTAGNAILCDNQADCQAAQLFSQTGQNLGGAAIQPGMFIHVYHNDEVWLARFGTAGTAPVVGVIAEYDAK